MATDTSKEAWEFYSKSKELSECYNTVLSILSSNAGNPLTGREICEKAHQDGLWKRLREMERMGAIVVKDKRHCTITKKMAYTWSLK